MTINVFGFGTTLYKKSRPKNIEIYPAKLADYQRLWAHRDKNEKNTDLTLIPVDKTEILGIVMVMNEKDEWLIQKRENDYHEIKVELSEYPRTTGREAITFISDNRYRKMANDDYPIYLSDIYNIILGYHEWYGLDGVKHLWDTTLGWNSTIYDDSIDKDEPYTKKEEKLVKKILKNITELQTLCNNTRYDLKL